MIINVSNKRNLSEQSLHDTWMAKPRPGWPDGKAAAACDRLRHVVQVDLHQVRSADGQGGLGGLNSFFYGLIFPPFSWFPWFFPPISAFPRVLPPGLWAGGGLKQEGFLHNNKDDVGDNNDDDKDNDDNYEWWQYSRRCDAPWWRRVAAGWPLLRILSILENSWERWEFFLERGENSQRTSWGGHFSQ